MELSSTPELSLLLSQKYHRRRTHCLNKLHLLTKQKLSTAKQHHSGKTVTDDHLDPPRSNLDVLARAKSYVRSVSNQAVLIVAYSASVGSSLNETGSTCPRQAK